MRIAIILLALALEAQAAREGFFTIGPTLHFNFGAGGWEPSLGVEYGFWYNKGNDFGVPGWDVGLDFSRNRVRLYGEVQRGFIGGGSIGPYLVIPFQGNPRERWGGGMQASIWGAYFMGGADLRGRIGTDGEWISPGVFAKYFDCLGGCKNYWN